MGYRRKKCNKENTNLGSFKIDEVLPYTGKCAKDKKYTSKEGISYSIHMNSYRYQTFKKNLKCVCCGLEGTKFILEMPYGVKRPHFNLYGKENGKLVLITKDHILPKSKGGKDNIENLQTMCTICNKIKRSSIAPLNLIKELRLQYNKPSDINELNSKLEEMLQGE